MQNQVAQCSPEIASFRDVKRRKNRSVFDLNSRILIVCVSRNANFVGGSAAKLAKGKDGVAAVDDINAATRRLQLLWRKKFSHLTTQCVVRKYFSSGPTIAHVKSIRCVQIFHFFIDFLCSN